MSRVGKQTIRDAVVVLLVGAGLGGAALPARAQAQLWAARYDGGGVDGDASPGTQRCLAVDGTGNLYVTGRADNGSNDDFLTVKYDSSGAVVWSRRYTGPAEDDQARALAVDASGNVYVTGMSMGVATVSDYATVKYDANGVQQWVARYDSPANDWDEAWALAIDAGGNVYVTGQSRGLGFSYDYATVKYDANGVQQWVARYDGPAAGFDVAYAVTVDAGGNVYVTGYSTGSGTGDDYATVKYDANGVEQWVARYDGPGAGSDVAYALAVDASGNVYVTGSSAGSGTGDDYATVKYDAGGAEQWVARYDGPGNSTDAASALAVDGTGNVYVTGYAAGSATGGGPGYATVKYDAAGEQQWVAPYAGSAQNFARALALDASGSVYVTGYSTGSGAGFDYATVKYDAGGAEQWVARYSGPGNSLAAALALDANGNVYVTGNSFDGSTNDLLTVKYDASGAQQWAVPEPPSRFPNEGASSLAVDALGNVYVTGVSGNGPSLDYLTVKYDASGALRWAVSYDGPGNGWDQAHALAVDGSGNVYVTGRSVGAGTGDDYATVKYDASGAQQWVARYNGPGNASDQAVALAVDASGSVYVTGYSDGGGTYNDYATVKYDTNGMQQWVARYNGPANGDDKASALALDGSGNAYVTGYSYAPGPPVTVDLTTAKYDAGGAQQWVARYNGPPGSLGGAANALAVDGGGNVYVTGYTVDPVTTQDYATVKYDAGGTQQWAASYNGPGKIYDVANAVAVDASGNVYVTGYSYGAGAPPDWATVKYDAGGAEQWVARYDGPAHSTDVANALALDGSGNVYVTGYTVDPVMTQDYATVKYDAGGTQQWSMAYDGGFDDQASAIAVLAGATYVTGSSNGQTSYDFLTIKYGTPDSTPPTDPTSLASPTHPVSGWSSLTQIGMQWSGAADEPGGSGLAGYSVLFDTSPSTVADATIDIPQGTDPHATTSPALPDGTSHYFHLRTCDAAGNCSGGLHAGPYWIDATAPGTVSALQSTSHPVGVPTPDPTIDVVWTAAPDNLSGIDGYSYFFGGSATAACDDVKDVEETTTGVTSASLADGTWYVHVCAVDNAGNWGAVADAGPYVIVTQADLAITKDDGVASAVPGQSVTYTIGVSNGGSIAVAGATVTDSFPSALTCTWACAAAGGNACTASGSGNIADAVTLAPGGSVAYTASCTISPSATGTLVNTAIVAPPAGVSDPNAGNNSATDTDTLTAEADLGVTQSDSPDPVLAGGSVTYTVTLTNGGPSDATGVTLTDTLPAGVAFVSSTPGAPTCSEAGGTVSCSLGGLAAGAGGVVTIDVQTSASGTLVNAAAVAAAETDPATGNNTATESTQVVGDPVGELVHGSSLRLDLRALPGPTQDTDVFRISQAPHGSYEVLVDGISGDLGPAGPALDRVQSDGTTVIQSSLPLGAGFSRSLRWENATASVVDDERIRVESAGCSTGCGPEDAYGIRAHETTYRVARFNNSGTQITVLLMQNTSAMAVTGTIWFWDTAGALVGGQGFTLDPQASMALNTSSVVSGAGGSMTISNDGPYGALVGKAVAVEPATGFTFDTPMLARAR